MNRNTDIGIALMSDPEVFDGSNQNEIGDCPKTHTEYDKVLPA